MTPGSPQVEHIRVRPSWDCVVCRRPWPCPSARESLLREFQDFPTVLTIFLATHMYDAFDDLAAQGPLPPSLLYERFLQWVVVRPPEPGGHAKPGGDSDKTDGRDAGSAQ